MMTFFKQTTFIIAALVAFFFFTTLSSCKPKNNEGQENITTIKVTLSSLSHGDQTFSYKNLKGTVTKDSIKLILNEVYTCNLELIDESQTPDKDITTEVQENATEHQFFFIVSPNGFLEINNLDKDKNGKDFGLSSRFTPLAKQNGTLRIVLKHLGDEPKTNNIDDGETDLDITFDVIVN
ncbi:MAG TPA: hypothetical protein PLM55_11195 [Chitinophagales bacterium]|nr:hypothetical protein [Chitinophagales bacterium]